jgi:hypothetical protein
MIDQVEYSARLQKFNRLAVPFEMILDCGSTVEAVRAELEAVRTEVYLSEAEGSNAFCSSVKYLIAWGDGSPKQREDMANKSRNLLFPVCGL